MIAVWLRKAALVVTLPALLFALVWVASAQSANFYFPPLAAVLQQFDALWLGPRFWNDVVPSFERLMAGYALAAVLGIGLGLAVGLHGALRRAVEPVLEFFRAVPPVAMIPLLIVSMGFGAGMKVTVIAAGAIWPILLNTVEGVKAAEPVLDEVCRTYRIGGLARIRHYILPGAMPQVMVGLRLGLSIGIVLMVISEMFAALDGLGAAIIYFQRSYEIPQMWSGVLMLGLFGFVLSLVFSLVERQVLGWYHGMRSLERKH